MRLKPVYLTNKAQALSEMAIFGGVLLLVLSYFVTMGLRSLAQQDVQMRAFRMALNEAWNMKPRPDAAASVTLLEDKRVPDPRDLTGRGDFITVAAQGGAVWGNQMQNPVRDPIDDMPRINYVINDIPSSYTTATLATLSYTMYDYLWVQIPEEPNRRRIKFSNTIGNDLRCYKPTDTSPLQARILLGGMTTEIITDVSETEDGPMWRIVEIRPIKPNTLNDGDEIPLLDVMMPESGALAPNYMDANVIKEAAGYPPAAGTQDLLQGLLPVAKMETRRIKNSLQLDEFPASGLGVYRSTTEFDTTGTTVTHYIRMNAVIPPGPVIPFSYTFPEAGEKGKWYWQTDKE